MTDAGGAIAIVWDKTLASVPFRISNYECGIRNLEFVREKRRNECNHEDTKPRRLHEEEKPLVSHTASASVVSGFSRTDRLDQN
ncbi:MAG: hypothetical protein DMF98_27710 [Acidobacteria bacterium]|nr:MAG: hypothetical protein DMF98_27710 [Acidobacteriota bacterium]